MQTKIEAWRPMHAEGVNRFLSVLSCARRPYTPEGGPCRTLLIPVISRVASRCANVIQADNWQGDRVLVT
jgi:hypothetical protein